MDKMWTKQGWLQKEGSKFKTWKKRFFRLHGLTLLYYENDKEITPPRGVVFLDGCLVRESDKKQKHSFSISGPKRDIRIICENEETKKDWMFVLSSNIQFEDKQKQKQDEKDRKNKAEVEELKSKIDALENENTERKRKQLELHKNIVALTEQNTELQKKHDERATELHKKNDEQLKSKMEQIAKLEDIVVTLEKQNLLLKANSMAHSRSSSLSLTDEQPPQPLSQQVAENPPPTNLQVEHVRRLEQELSAVTRDLVQAKLDRKTLKAEVRRLMLLVHSTDAAAAAAAAAAAPS